jgi:hypothetical protein
VIHETQESVTRRRTCCDVLPSNRTVISGFWLIYLDLLDKSSGGITINYYTLNLTVSTLR